MRLGRRRKLKLKETGREKTQKPIPKKKKSPHQTDEEKKRNYTLHHIAQRKERTGKKRGRNVEFGQRGMGARRKEKP